EALGRFVAIDPERLERLLEPTAIARVGAWREYAGTGSPTVIACVVPAKSQKGAGNSGDLRALGVAWSIEEPLLDARGRERPIVTIGEIAAISLDGAERNGILRHTIVVAAPDDDRATNADEDPSRTAHDRRGATHREKGKPHSPQRGASGGNGGRG